MKSRIILFLSALFMINSSLADFVDEPQTTSKVSKVFPRDKKTPPPQHQFPEPEEQNFIFNNNVCTISKQEIQKAQNFILSAKDAPPPTQQKIALVILQLKLINNAKFNDILCGLRYFNESSNNQTRNYYGESQDTLAPDYLDFMEKLRTDSKTKSDFEENILNAKDIDYYYRIITKMPDGYNLLNIDIARKIFLANINNKPRNNILTLQEQKLLFDLYYSKKISPPKNITDNMIASYLKHNYMTDAFLKIYIESADEISYQELLPLFNNLPAQKFISLGGDISDAIFLKSIFTSKYLPENFKCDYARNVVVKNAHRIPAELIPEIREVKSDCLDEALLLSSKYINTPGTCPQILFDDKTPREKIISGMNINFSKSWISCRTRCEKGDECIPVSSNSGIFSFINKKYEKDVATMKEIQNKDLLEVIPFKYSYRPAATCSERGICAEKVSCTNSDIVTKVNNELKASKYQYCKEDNDCYIMDTEYAECAQFATNLNPFPAQGEPFILNAQGVSATTNSNTKKTRNVRLVNQYNFLSKRLQSLTETCGRSSINTPYSICRERAYSEVKCLKNLCTLVK